MFVIRSSSNAVLKRIRAVSAGKERDLILLEGDRLIDEALACDLNLEEVVVVESRVERGAELESRGLSVRWMDAGLLQRVSRLETSPGILALAQRPPETPIEDFSASPESLVCVVAGIADPGNLGAVARTAEAAGCEALVSVAGSASPWNEKALRGSMGSLLRLPVSRGEAADIRARLDALGYRHLAAATRGGPSFDTADYSGPLALWFASETGEWPRGLGDLPVATIPMAGRVESLNVTVAAALMLYAAGRTVQRGDF